MKGDMARDVTCPKCGHVLHPRFNKARTRRGSTYATPEHIMRGALRQHLVFRHPDLGPRDISLLLDKVIG